MNLDEILDVVIQHFRDAVDYAIAEINALIKSTEQSEPTIPRPFRRWPVAGMVEIKNEAFDKRVKVFHCRSNC